MTRSDLIFKRLNNQKLSASEFQRTVDVVCWMGAVQAQDFNGAKWALALRMRKATNAVVEEAFNRGEILRTHIMRPTWHFVAPEDIRWLLDLTAPRVNLRAGPNYRQFELDAAVFKRSHKALTKALQGGKHLTRSALKSVLNRAGIDANDPVRLAHILLRAELDGIVCSGPRSGKQFTYALLEERVPAAKKTLNRDEALAEITRRYFKSHGPATLQDFVWWSGLTVADARRGIAQVDREFEKEEFEEKVYWGPGVTQAKSNFAAHLLPAYDEYFVAYKDRQTLVDLKDGKPLTSWDVLGPTIIIDGIAVGRWKRTNSCNIELDASRALKKPEKLNLKQAVDRYSAFL